MGGSEQDAAPPARALVFGEALWDLLPSGPVLGGAPLNFAYRLASMGVPTRFVSQVGVDDLGRRTLDQMRALGMDTALVHETADLPTATVVVELDEHRNPSYTIVERVAYDAIPWSDALGRAAGEADILCFGTLVQRDPRSRETLQHLVQAFGGSEVLVDINLRPRCYTEETVRWSLEHGTIAKLNDEELAVIARMYGLEGDDMRTVAARLCLVAHLEVVVVTLGPLGALAASKRRREAVVPGFAVEVDDPCGSGDAFAAAFMATLVDGGSIESALERGNALGALVATQPGATQPVSRDEVENLITNGQRATLPASAFSMNRRNA